MEIKGFKEGDTIRVLVGYLRDQTGTISVLVEDTAEMKRDRIEYAKAKGKKPSELWPIGVRLKDVNTYLTTWFQPHEIVKITE